MKLKCVYNDGSYEFEGTLTVSSLPKDPEALVWVDLVKGRNQLGHSFMIGRDTPGSRRIRLTARYLKLLDSKQCFIAHRAKNLPE